MEDFGLLVARFNTSTPAYTDDNDLRELRIDAGGRVHSRLSDGNDNHLSYFADADAVGSGDPDDRGILILGKNDTDSNYQVLRVNSDGSLVVSSLAGTDISEHSDKTGTWGASDTVGEVALVLNTWVKIVEIPVGASLTAHITGWEFLSDKNTQFQMVMSDDTGADGHARTDATEVLSSAMTTSSRPSDHATFSRAKDRAGGTNVAVVVWAKQLQSGAAGVASAAIEANTTS